MKFIYYDNRMENGSIKSVSVVNFSVDLMDFAAEKFSECFHEKKFRLSYRTNKPRAAFTVANETYPVD